MTRTSVVVPVGAVLFAFASFARAQEEQLTLDGYSEAAFGTPSPSIPSSAYSIQHQPVPTGPVYKDVGIEIGSPSGAGGNYRTWRFTGGQYRSYGNLYEMNSSTFTSVGVGTPFKISDLTYFNAETFATSASVFTLPTSVKMNFTNLVGAPAPVFDFNFRLTFTTNTPGPVDDTLEFINAAAPQTFTSGSKTYTLELAGFSGDGGNTFTNTFRLPEYQQVSSSLYARVVEVVGPRLFMSSTGNLKMQTRIGTSTTADLVVQNSGAAGTTLTGTVTALAPGKFGPNNAQGFELDAGESITRTYTYTPTARTNGLFDSAVVNVVSNAGPAEDVFLLGEAFGPVYDSTRGTSGSINLGRVVGGSGGTILTIFNNTPDGDLAELTNLTVRGINITGANASSFSVSGVQNGAVIIAGNTQVHNEKATIGTVAGQRGNVTAQLVIDTDVNAAFGADGQNYTHNLLAQLIDQRPITASQVNFNRVMVGQAVTLPTTISSQTTDNFYTNPTLRKGGATAGEVSVAAVASDAVINTTSFSQNRNVTANFSQHGPKSGLIPLSVTREGVLGENNYNLAVPYSAQAVENRLISATPVDLGKHFAGEPMSAATELTSPGDFSRYTTVTLKANTYTDGVADVVVDAPIVFNGTTTTGSATVNLSNAAPGKYNQTINLGLSNNALQGEGLTGEQVRNVGVNYTADIYSHGTPSFQSGSFAQTLNLDFGTLTLNSGTQTREFNLFNLLSSTNTAAIDFDGVSLSSGQTSKLYTNLPSVLEGLTAGGSQSFLAHLDTSTTGTFTAQYVLDFHDDRTIGGAGVLDQLTLNLSGVVAGGVSTPPRTTITIFNPGFEEVRTDFSGVVDIPLLPGEATYGMSNTYVTRAEGDFGLYIPAWFGFNEADGLSGVARPAGDPYDASGFTGENVAYITSDQFQQFALGTFDPEETYTFSFKVGRPSSGAWAAPNVDVLLNGLILQPISADEPTPLPGQFQTWTYLYRVGSADPNLGGDVAIFATGGGGMALLDDFLIYISGSDEGPSTSAEWIYDGSGYWSEDYNWSGGLPPNSTDSEARFGGVITYDATVAVNLPVTLGTLRFDNAAASYDLVGPAPIKLKSTSNGLIDVASGEHTISTGLVLASDTSVVVDSGARLDLNGSIDNTEGHTITKDGSGTLVLAGPQDHADGTLLRFNGGTTELNANAGAGSGKPDVTVGQNATLKFGASQDLASLIVNGHLETPAPTSGTTTLRPEQFQISSTGSAQVQRLDMVSNVTNHGSLTISNGGDVPQIVGQGALTVDGGTLTLDRLTQSSLTVTDGATVSMNFSSPGAPKYQGDNAMTSRLDMLDIAHDGAPLGQRQYFGQLDLANNDLIIDYDGASPLAELTDMIRSGFNSFGWNGNGIASSVSGLDPLKWGLGIIDNAELAALGIAYGDGTTGPLFHGQVVDDTSILIKFTYMGDADLDGLVTPADYFFIDVFGYGGAYNGWLYGDFDYDGVAGTPSDYFFIDQNWFGDSRDVSLPEPASCLSLVSLAGLIMRRRRRVA